MLSDTCELVRQSVLIQRQHTLSNIICLVAHNTTNACICSAGYTPIVTCSPVNNALCKSYGAAACFDYHSATCGADIREYTANNLTLVFDCVTDTPTMRMCYEAIGSSGGKYFAIEAIDSITKYTRRDVLADWLMAPTIMGTRVEMAGTYGRPSTPEHRRFRARLFLLVEKLLSERALKTHLLEIRDGGLAQIPTYINNVRVRARGVQAKRQVVCDFNSHLQELNCHGSGIRRTPRDQNNSWRVLSRVGTRHRELQPRRLEQSQPGSGNRKSH